MSPTAVKDPPPFFFPPEVGCSGTGCNRAGRRLHGLSHLTTKLDGGGRERGSVKRSSCVFVDVGRRPGVRWSATVHLPAPFAEPRRRTMASRGRRGPATNSKPPPRCTKSPARSCTGWTRESRRIDFYRPWRSPRRSWPSTENRSFRSGGVLQRIWWMRSRTPSSCHEKTGKKLPSGPRSAQILENR
jgi:hypothetical protein